MKWNVFKQERITFEELQLWVLEAAEGRGPALNHGGAALCQEGRSPAFTMAGRQACLLLLAQACPHLPSGPLAVSLWGLVDVPGDLIYEHLPG